MKVAVSREARIDLENIYRFTIGRWDMEQADGYVAAIRAAIGALETNFGAMRPVAVFGSRLFRLNVGSHAIWARVSGDVIRVVRVLHQRMDPAKHL